MTIQYIDLNCDMGEGVANDATLMPFISSANIACGAHAGDEDTMQQTVALAMQYSVAIGAHPSFDDKENFGRTEMQLTTAEAYTLVLQQVQLLDKICMTAGATLHHVKPHGALYNMAAKDATLSAAIAQAVFDINPAFILYGLSGSHLISEVKKLGLKTASEVFADRTYRDDGSLTPRSQSNALIEDEAIAMKQILQFVQQKTVTGTSGKIISLQADTICIHGDGKHAVAFAKRTATLLKEKNILIESIR
ncbi:MAG: 5-oxoprolinase subunit PxpA [Ferruginibacter sp.]